MKIYAISDLHLPGGERKPMDVFGAHWEGHFEKIRRDWSARVAGGDVVLIPGDISWAMHLSRALEDLSAIGALPGRKILLRGNHDYWWSSLAQLRAALPAGMYALQNDALCLQGIVFCGTRGWTIPDGEQEGEDAKIYRREVLRLELSLRAARRMGGGRRLIALTHYPPFNERREPSEVTALLEEYGVSDVVYGHLHGASLKHAFTGTLRGVRYHQVSCDGLRFALYRLPEPPVRAGEAEG